jgi:hypothetical protein
MSSEIEKNAPDPLALLLRDPAQLRGFPIETVKELAALINFAEIEIEDCYSCDGSGKPDGGEDGACRNCGGIGRVASRYPLPEEIEQARAALIK